MTKHAYLPTTLISDEGSTFVSHVIKEVAGVLGNTMKHATTKHLQTIGLLERTHASLKKVLKIETGERRIMWHKYVNIAVLIYNSSYHTSIACEPSEVIHGRVPNLVPDLKKGIVLQKNTCTKFTNCRRCPRTNVNDIPRCPPEHHARFYHDKETKASKLKEQQYMYVPQPEADH